MMDRGNLIVLITNLSDAAEFVNKSKRPSAEKTEKNVERCRLRGRTFNNLGNVYGCDDECGDIHGKEFHE